MSTKNNTENAVLTVERTEQEIIDAMREFTLASFEEVGATNTYNTIKFMTKQVLESPETYRKIFHPKTIEKLNQLSESRRAGAQMGMMEMMALVGEITTILS